ncbi:hypothetical protein [Streptomyces sp. ADI92-24]|uniref:hypothetical protein n=1 Tax=Streptomyces sp. ADI92-24 TaxID=1522756 RepID=UPI001F154F82|nr:hypothetical protein [Streptomyces sp. ADI92-24]
MYDVDMFADEVEQLAQQADQAEGAERVELLARAANLAIDPLRRIELLMLVADAAGRAAHQTVAPARRGENRAGNRPATYEQIGAAAGLSRDVVYRQHAHGAALSWPAKRRGVHNGRTSSCREAAAEKTNTMGETVK